MHAKPLRPLVVASDRESHLRDAQINAFLDAWNLRRNGRDRPDLYGPRSSRVEQEMDASKRLHYRQVIGGFVDRFRPDRRDFRRRVHERCRHGHALSDALMAQALSEMGVEALKRHIGVAMMDDEAGRRALLDLYEMHFLPPPARSSAAGSDPE
jgi:hypothetical protein